MIAVPLGTIGILPMMHLEPRRPRFLYLYCVGVLAFLVPPVGLALMAAGSTAELLECCLKRLPPLSFAAVACTFLSYVFAVQLFHLLHNTLGC